MAESEKDLWELLKPASYQADGYPEIRFPVVDLEKSGGLRIARRRRPYRPGSRLDNVGRKEYEWSIQAVFHNDVDEDGLGTDPQMWPDRLDDLEEQFASGETATLHLPWQRNIRGKAEDWKRRGAPDMTDGETLSFTFVEDTEEQLMGAAIESVSIRSQTNKTAEEAYFDADSSGAWDGSFEDLTQFAADLEGALNAPGELLDDVKHKANRVRNACEAIEESIGGRIDGDDPEHERIWRKVGEIKDTASGAEGEAVGRSRTIVTRSWATDRDIYSIASDLGQSANDLISINGEIEDLSIITAGTAVKVFA